MTTDQHTNPAIQGLIHLRGRAEGVVEKALDVANELRADLAKKVLQDQFPHHSLAIFERDWDEHQPRLIQLLTSHTGSEDIDLTDSNPAALPQADRDAIYLAQSEIQKIGDDDEVLKYLHAGEDHEGWEEFQLSLIEGESRV